MEDYAVALKTKQCFPLIGLDLVAGGSAYTSTISSAANIAQREEALKYLGDNDSVWVGESLGRKPGEHLQLLINDRAADYVVRGVYHDSNGNEAAIVMDLAAAQRVLDRFGRVDLILVKVPQTPGFEEWQQRLRAVLPPGVEVNPQGTGTNENPRMLGAFRWNLRLLSYIALVVRAFLIYNPLSVSVVRRRAEIGVVRAIGASRAAVLSAFVGEAAFFGLAGAVIGLPLGRLMAIGAVKLMAATVESLYVSSRPGPLELDFASVLLCFVIRVGISVASAFSPAREASLVSPMEAMARGRREYAAQVHKRRDLWFALAMGVAAAAASRAPSVAGKPAFGSFSVALLIIAVALAIPPFGVCIPAPSRYLV